MPDKPNVLFIVSDQHNAKVLGHKDHPDVQTPNLDRLAAEGVRCDNAITQNPICTPSRVSFLSGQYCHNHGYYGLSGPNPNGLPTVLGHFRRHGYVTAALGKIHCPEYWVEDDSDVFHETGGASVGGRSPEYAAYLAERGLTDLEDHGALNEFGRRGRQTVEGRASKVSFEDGQEGWCCTKAAEFMRDCADAGRAFFCHVSLPKPHQCYTPAPEFWDLYDESALHLPPNADASLEGKAPHLRRAAERWRKGDWTLFEPRTFEAGRLRKLHGYLGNVSHVDHAVGRLLDFLRDAGLEEDTIVVYTSDHGDYACEHGIMEKAPGICADAITRVPCLWRLPGRLPAGRVAEELVELVDVAPTLCSLAGLGAMDTADGLDVSDLLAGGPAVREVAVTEFAWSRSIRKGRFRLVTYAREKFAEEYPDGFCELYDLEADPWEMTNLALDATYGEKVAEMHRDLVDWLMRTTRVTTVLPHWTGEPAPGRRHRYKNTVLADGRIGCDQLRQRKNSPYV
ncbi:MAG: sulfatase [Planctomycetota bacterium]